MFPEYREKYYEIRKTFIKQLSKPLLKCFFNLTPGSNFFKPEKTVTV